VAGSLGPRSKRNEGGVVLAIAMGGGKGLSMLPSQNEREPHCSFLVRKQTNLFGGLLVVNVRG